MRRFVQALTLVSALGIGGAAQAVQDEQEKSDEAAESGAKETEDEEEEEEEERWLALVGGDIHTGTGGRLRAATLLARDGVIEEIGYDLEIPEGAETLDVSGMSVYPGLVAISSFGLLGGGDDLANTVDPFHRNMVLGLASGITSAVQGNQAAKLKRGEIEGVVMNPKIFANFSFTNSDPKSKRGMRDRFREAAEYLRVHKQWREDVKKDKTLKEPKAPKDGSPVDVLRGEIRPKFFANDREDLLGIARLAQEFGFRPVIEGCVEGWTVADELGRAGAFAIVTARARSTKRENLVREGGSSIENAKLLHRAGVQVAIVPANRSLDLQGSAGRDIMHLPIEADFAVRGGLSEEAALSAITIVPARLMGVGHRLGTIEVGKDCDVVVTDGDILHYQTFVQWAVVDGKLVYDKEDELFFAHIRPRPETALAPEAKTDAGESEGEEAGAVPDAEELDEGEEADEEGEEADEEGEENTGGGDDD